MFSRIAERYQGCTAVVIGVGGIGGQIIQMLSGRVANLVIVDRDSARLAETATGLESGGTRVFTRPLDVRDPAAAWALFEWIQSTVGAPDYLFYAAGVLNLEPFTETTPDLWTRAVDINLNGAFYCTSAAAERMREAGRGSIMLVGSIAGTKARSGSRVNPVYNATKAALAAFVNSAAMSLRSHGVRINCISPGPTATAMMDLQPPSVLDAVQRITLDARMNEPSEVAELALFVAAHGRFTGEDLAMGGGAGLGG